MLFQKRIGTEIGLIGSRIKTGFLNKKDNVSGMQTAMVDKTRRAARRTDYYIHENAWKMMVLSAGAAFALGFFFSRRNQEAIAMDLQAEAAEGEEKIKKLNTWEFIHSTIPLTLFLWKAVQASRCARKETVQ